MESIYLSVIIPCFNEEEVIKTTHSRIIQVLNDNDLINYELLFINDGSKDRTLEILTKLTKENSKIKIINFSRNFGHQSAVSAGISNCSGQLAVIMDADLQDPPELIPKMIKKLSEEHCNVVYGVRTKRKGETWFKKITAKWYYKIINSLSDIKLPGNTGDFKLIDRKIIEEFKKLPETNKYIRGLISWIGFKHSPIYYEREARTGGTTKYPLSKMLHFAGIGLIYFTKKPLSLAITLGLFSIFIGLLLAIYVIWAILFSPQQIVLGWASTIITIIFFGGVQLLSVGVLGRYIGCVFDEVKKRPEYIIENKINF